MAKLPWYMKAVKAKEKGIAYHIKVNPWWILWKRIKLICKTLVSWQQKESKK